MQAEKGCQLRGREYESHNKSDFRQHLVIRIYESHQQLARPESNF